MHVGQFRRAVEETEEIDFKSLRPPMCPLNVSAERRHIATYRFLYSNLAKWAYGTARRTVRFFAHRTWYIQRSTVFVKTFILLALH